ncbi:nucleotidyltransferase family protein [candidate division KSB1 bacterium]|nr:nucleotidyltransferase family protein [candidate division KSB1 bacterium]
MTLDREFDIVLLALKRYLHEKAPFILNHQAIDWDRLLHIATVHRVTALVYHVLKTADGVPETVREKFRHIVLYQSAGSVRAVRELNALLQQFYNRHLKVVPFKGNILAAELYGDVVQRPSLDFDLYVPKKHIGESVRLLHDLGYTSGMLQQKPDLRPGSKFHSLEFSHPQKSPIDLHWDATDGYVTRLYTRHELDNALRTLSIENKTIHIFDQDVTLALLAIHGAKGSWAFVSSWIDLAMFFRRHPQFSYSTVLRTLRARGMARMLYIGAYLVERFLDVTTPRLIKQNADYRSCEIARCIGHRLFQNPLQPMDGGWAKVLLNVQFREKLSEKLRYLAFKSRSKKVDMNKPGRRLVALKHVERVAKGR